MRVWRRSVADTTNAIAYMTCDCKASAIERFAWCAVPSTSSAARVDTLRGDGASNYASTPSISISKSN